MAVFNCGYCDYERDVPDKLLGKKAKCPQCGHGVTIVDAVPLAEEGPGGDVDPESISYDANLIPPSSREAFDLDDMKDEALSGASFDGGVADIVCPGCGHAMPGDGGANCSECGNVLQRPDSFLDVSEDDVDLSDLADDHSPKVWDADYPDSTGRMFTEVEERPEGSGRRLLQGNFVLNAFAGLVSGFLAFFFALALAVLSCSGAGLHPFLPYVIMTSLTAALVGGVFYSLQTRIPFALAGPETVLAAVMFLFIGSLYKSMAGLYPTDSMLPTILAAVSLAAVSVGIVLWLLGKFKTAEYVRFIPIQIIGGVVGGVGVFVLLGTLDWMTEFSLNWSGSITAILDCFTAVDPAQCLHSMGPSIVFGIILFAGLSRFKNSLFMLALVLVASAAGYAAGVWGTEESIRSLAAPIPLTGDILAMPVEVLRSGFGTIEWGVIKENGLYIGGLIVLVVLTTMYRITNLELIHGRESDLNQEYRSLGVTNILSGLCAGMPASISYGRSAGSYAAGARGPIAGIVAGLLCAGGLFYADLVIPMIPRFVPEGILIYAGLDLIRDWLFRTKTAFTRRDDVVMLWTTFLVTLLLGLLAGIGVGVGLALIATVSRYSKGGSVRNALSGVNHRSNVDRAPAQQRTLKEYGDHIHILRLQGFIFLGSMERLLRAIRERVDNRDMLPVEYLIIDFKLVTGLASAAGIGFQKLANLVNEFGMELIITSAPLELEEHLVTMGYVGSGSEDGEEPGVFKVFFNLDYALEWCENHVLDSENMLEMKRMTLPELLAPVFPEPKFIPALMKVLKKVVINKGEAVFRQGDASDAMYFVESGRLDVELELEGGKLLRLKKVGPGAVFGEMGIYTLAARSATIRAAEKCVLYMMTMEKLDAVEKRAPVLVTAINRYLINMLSERLVDANSKVRDLMQ